MTAVSAKIDEIKHLPCFSHILSITSITAGSSQNCYKVTDSSGVYFTKSLHPLTAKAEISATQLAASNGLSPLVVYSNNEWLVCEYIDNPLETSQVLSTPINLMAKLHQIALPNNLIHIPCLNVQLIADDLIHSSDKLKTSITIDCLSKVIIDFANYYLNQAKSSQVLCHGDLNFSNILSGEKEQNWLIDFECTQIAPIEFDIAMFIAINNINPEGIKDVLSLYNRFYPAPVLNSDLVNGFVLYAHYINALWYFNRINDEQLDCQFKAGLIEQCEAFDGFAKFKAMTLPSLSSSLLV